MVESPMPQDILKHKTKFIMNLSIRETIFGALGLGLGVFAYFSWGSAFESQEAKMFITFIVSLPFFLIGFVKIYEQPFEKIAFTLVLENFIYPAKRKKEVHHPEWEKYEKTRRWNLEAVAKAEAREKELLEVGTKEAKKELAKIKKEKEKSKKTKVKALQSTEYPGIK